MQTVSNGYETEVTIDNSTNFKELEIVTKDLENVSNVKKIHLYLGEVLSKENIKSLEISSEFGSIVITGRAFEIFKEFVNQ